ncbi:MAG: hypothetical protein U0414_38990 [Polyangiaceae bacterium]
MSGRIARAIVLGALSLGALARASEARADEADECASKAEEGQTLRDQSKFIEAREDFARCARDTCPSVVRKDCNGWVADMDAKIPTVVFAVKDPHGNDVADVSATIGGATIALSGKAVPMNPGSAHVTFDAKGIGTGEVDVVVREGEKARIVEVTVGKADRPKSGDGAPGAKPADAVETRTPTAFVVTPWVMAGLSAASLATFGALQGIARGELSDIEAGCGATRTCAPEVIDPVQTKFTASAVLFGVSIATLATAVGLWVFAPKVPVDRARSASSALSLDVFADPSGAGIGLRWSPR